MTPPIILGRGKKIPGENGIMFYTQGLNTALGCLTISLLGPREIFDTNFDYAK